MNQIFKGQSLVQLKSFKVGEFNRGVGKLTEVCWYLAKVIFFLSPIPYPSSFKSFILKLFGAKVGARLVLKPRVNIHFPWKIIIGDDVWIGEETFILNFETVIIGSNCCISQRAFLCGGNHNYRLPDMPYRNAPIFIEDGAWIGAQTFIGPGVTVGTDTVVSAASVVTKDLNANSVYSGNPASYQKPRWQTA